MCLIPGVSFFWGGLYPPKKQTALQTLSLGGLQEALAEQLGAPGGANGFVERST